MTSSMPLKELIRGYDESGDTKRLSSSVPVRAGMHPWSTKNNFVSANSMKLSGSDHSPAIGVI